MACRSQNDAGHGTPAGAPGAAGRIIQISVSSGGVPKRPVPSSRVTMMGLEGDTQRNRRLHGGPDRALCLFSYERIRALQAEGHPIAPGAIGENLTIAEIDWTEVRPGSCLRLGPEVAAQVTRFTSPCLNIAGAFCERAYSRVAQDRYPGDSRVYARILREGYLTTGDPVRLITEDEALSLIGHR